MRHTKTRRDRLIRCLTRDSWQLVSEPQTRLAHCCGQSLPKGFGPPECGSPCVTVLSHSCARPTGICNERVRCFVLEGYPPIEPPRSGVIAWFRYIFVGQRPQGCRGSGILLTPKKGTPGAVYYDTYGWYATSSTACYKVMVGAIYTLYTVDTFYQVYRCTGY